MKVLKTPCQGELVIQKSRFLAILEPLADAQAAREKLKHLKSVHPDAAHVVHAFQVGLGNSLTGGCSDDGEPPGTAGRPVYDVLKGFGCSQVFLAVVRYFGGIKLGTGGLVKAYGDAAKLVLNSAEWEEYRALDRVEVVLEYGEHRPFLNLLNELDGQVEREEFGEKVHLFIAFPSGQKDNLGRVLGDLTKGRIASLPLA